MSTLTGLIGGGKVIDDIKIFYSSTTYTPASDCEAVVYVLGAGGSGAAYSSTALNHHCSGGGAGGLASSRLDLSSSVTYTVTIGSGGAARSGNGVNGLGGGNSVFSGTGITTMTGNGGQGGDYGAFSDAALARSGGTATGGNIFNYQGGGSGSVAGGSNNAKASGGGSVNFFNSVLAVTSDDVTNANGTSPAEDPFRSSEDYSFLSKGLSLKTIIYSFAGSQQGEAFWGSDGGGSTIDAVYGGGGGGLSYNAGASSGAGGDGLILIVEMR